MGASDAIRSGKLQAHVGKDNAGLRPYKVEIVTLETVLLGRPEIHQAATFNEVRLTIKPTPEVKMRRTESPRQYGSPMISDCTLVGAFFKSLTGTRKQPNGVSSPVIQTFLTPESVIAIMQSAAYFRIDGEAYQYTATSEGGTGSINIDAHKAEWTLKLVKSAKNVQS